MNPDQIKVSCQQINVFVTLCLDKKKVLNSSLFLQDSMFLRVIRTIIA